MPMYEFRCKSCEAVFEELIIRKKDTEELKCPECGSKEAERLLSGFASLGNTGKDGGLPSAPSCGSGGFS